MNRSIESSDSAVNVYVPVSLGKNVPETKTAKYSPLLGTVIPFEVNVVYVVKSNTTDGVDVPEECNTEFDKLGLKNLSKSTAFVGNAPYCDVDPTPACVDQT